MYLFDNFNCSSNHFNIVFSSAMPYYTYPVDLRYDPDSDMFLWKGSGVPFPSDHYKWRSGYPINVEINPCIMLNSVFMNIPCDREGLFPLCVLTQMNDWFSQGKNQHLWSYKWLSIKKLVSIEGIFF